MARFKDRTTAAQPGPGNDRPKKYRRLRVVMDDENRTGYKPSVRDVFLESTFTPIEPAEAPGEWYDGRWKVELCGLELDCRDVADLIRFAHKSGIPVVYEPANNMRGWLSQMPAGYDALLFDLGDGKPDDS